MDAFTLFAVWLSFVVMSADVNESCDNDQGCSVLKIPNLLTSFDTWLLNNDIKIPPSLKTKLEENYIASRYFVYTKPMLRFVYENSHGYIVMY